MDQQYLDRLPQFLDILGLDETPLGIFYSATQPTDGISPAPLETPTREREMEQAIDWQTILPDHQDLADRQKKNQPQPPGLE